MTWKIADSLHPWETKIRQSCSLKPFFKRRNPAGLLAKLENHA
jgi:hypothetical protein